MTDPRPAEGPDREALAALDRLFDQAINTCHDDEQEKVRADRDAVLALLPTPPAPGGDTADRALAAELTKAWERIAFLERMLRAAALGGGEGLRAEVERLIHEADTRPSNYLAGMIRVDDLRAALAARDTDQHSQHVAGTQPGACDECMAWLAGVAACAEQARQEARDTDQGAQHADGRDCADAEQRIEWLTGVLDNESRWARELRAEVGRLTAALAARDTDQGARDALAEVERLRDDMASTPTIITVSREHVVRRLTAALAARDTDQGAVPKNPFHSERDCRMCPPQEGCNLPPGMAEGDPQNSGSNPTSGEDPPRARPAGGRTSN
jgi:hypothetical protein